MQLVSCPSAQPISRNRRPHFLICRRIDFPKSHPTTRRITILHAPAHIRSIAATLVLYCSFHSTQSSSDLRTHHGISASPPFPITDNALVAALAGTCGYSFPGHGFEPNCTKAFFPVQLHAQLWKLSKSGIYTKREEKGKRKRNKKNYYYIQVVIRTYLLLVHPSPSQRFHIWTPKTDFWL